MFHQILDKGEAGDQMGVLLRGVKRGDLRRGHILAPPGTIELHNHFKAQVCTQVHVLQCRLQYIWIRAPSRAFKILESVVRLKDTHCIGNAIISANSDRFLYPLLPDVFLVKGRGRASKAFHETLSGPDVL